MADDNPDAVIYLHGDLDLKIIEARRLPNMDLVSERFRRCFTAFDTCRKPFSDKKDSQHHHKIITSDPYVTVCLAGATVARTRVISNSQSPHWNERFKIPLAHPVTHMEFHVKDNDVFGADLIGVATVPAGRIKSGETISDWFPIISSYGKPPKPDCAVHVEMTFTKCEENPLYKHGIAANPERYGVGNCYFPVRHGGAVTLYQDAHVADSMLPEIELENGRVFEHNRCWEDICHAILEAHHLVYIVGWSVFHKVRLVREPTKPLPSGGNLSLGDMLKYKSQEGLRVLLLVWDDKTSHSKFFINTTGVMQTHDEETRKFFKHSSVSCVLAPRYASSKLSIFKQQVVGTLFTHHQKCVIVDTQAHGNNRKITAFIGGLDLCDGRYDTPEHRLFRDLDTVFQDDYHNPTFSAGTKAPRQPWHDLHCKIEGPAAYDVLSNFEQRWRKATKWSEFGRRFKRVTHWHDDALIKLERISWILSPNPSIPNDDPSLWVSMEDDPENWHVQVFRSIDSGSVKGFPKDVYQAEVQNLVCAKNLVIDKSIQTAYIQAIRSAQHFIYIENQYFLGSAYAWPSYREAGADNIIPMELALKIVSKIRAKERFTVYIVIPMWPEGVPSSASVQEILFWQRQTMQMMYEIIAQELKAMNLENSDPQDYLNFYCLGNREEITKEASDLNSEHSDADEVVLASQKFQRFMIYVHAKGMIVDDEYVIMGSANINQRSLAGSRDTEIAMGAYQPQYTWGKKKGHPRGQVYGYRMSLWAEHMGKLDELFKEPESLDCVKCVNKIAEDNWKRFTADEFTPLHGHLLKYPVAVDGNGKVGALPGQENFPDVGGKVIGSRTTLPDALTT
ncbi:C2 domain-containing protein/PLDc domain-containing protein/PLD_C domain-containing protein/PLDc_2 domain-containing protein [Cephalotus follicularis]|uniref:Phospholipase D n=1 Tax=Cephalotus follicularis TaxID=3775 RepID=A0A1Q3ALR3_CEPFO|nr:C2 domain-containing protein/PLDc domain-containing protein/PLD_C domain-containing protein/PLDc_2 domain-containing protein [Cephalotus follicularis]